jgi:threonine dehydrogenase-like Zn-dependent dehydrogenase
MKAVFYTGNSRVEVREVPAPEPGPGDVLIRMAASAICGSELHQYHADHASQGAAGHEGVGEVVSAPETSGLHEHQMVAVQVLSGCGNCRYCLAGQWEHCTESRFHGGTHAEYMAVPVSSCRPVPPDIRKEDAVLLGGDVIGTPYHAIGRLGVSAADTVAVFGCGPIGLGAITVLRFLGSRILAVEPVAYRRELALKLGASVAIDPTDEDPVKRIRGLTGGRGTEVSLDCSDVAETVGQALDVAAVHGRMAFIGEKPQATVGPSPQLIRKELTAIGSWYFTGPDYFRILELYRRGLSLSGLVTHCFKLAEAEAAFALFASRQTGKVLLL